MAGYQFYGGAILPLGVDPVALGDPEKAMDGFALTPAPTHEASERTVFVTHASGPLPAARASVPLRPGDVLRAAKARVKEIRVELRHHARLERELVELERLIAAATKPPASVTRLSRTA